MSSTHSKSCNITLGLLAVLVIMVGYSIYTQYRIACKCGCMNNEYFIKYADDKREGLDDSQRAKRVKEGMEGEVSEFSKKYLQQK
jgi:hypothetical protein